VERGDALRTDQVPADHLRNHRLARFGHNTGPSLSGNPRVLVSDEGPQVLTPVDPGWNNNAMTLGGGTRVWGAQAWRMSPTDFRMATSAVGLFDEPVTDGAGPGPAIATCRFLHGNEGLVGGGMLADEFVKTPTSFWHTALPPGVPRWGMAGKVAMRDGYRRTAHVMGPIQELPNGAARVQLDHTVADHLGLPVARLSGNSHPDDYRTARFLADRALEWMEASGAAKVWSWPSPKLQPRLSAGQHQVGTCRIGTDPATSVCDPTGTLHDCPNVVLADGSVHVTNGGVNPTLTIMALAWRSAEALASRL
jgi:choline dehydrogenase-like flavoprotein